MANLEETERDKYRRMWSRSEYRRFSPGLSAAPRAHKLLGMKSGETLYDVGCGSGKAGAWFNSRGIIVTLIDFAPNALEVTLPFIDTAIWKIKNLPQADYVFCADVLEHIPESKVKASIKRIMEIGERGFLQIHCTNDGCGKLIGETLHMTVKPPEWWEAQIPHIKQSTVTGDSLEIIYDQRD